MSAAEAQEVKSLLLRSNDQYRQLSERHHQLDDRLSELTQLPYLTTSEQFEEVTLKKRKLALKDQMEQMALEYAKTHFRAS
ncbi:MAG TPA: YdcH family protein [Vicinamibacterales bacterium]|nr:YdcH family protein [Vicinamibacterales bacterium]